MTTGAGQGDRRFNPFVLGRSHACAKHPGTQRASWGTSGTGQYFSKCAVRMHRNYPPLAGRRREMGYGLPVFLTNMPL